MSERGSIRPYYASTQRFRIIIASEWYTFRAHFDRQAGRSRECAGEGCRLCGETSKPHVLYGAVGEMADRTLGFICLRSRHSELVQHLRASRVEGVGPELEIYKRSSAKNSPIIADYIGDWDVEPINADAFMATVLLPPLTRMPPTLRNTAIPFQEATESRENSH